MDVFEEDRVLFDSGELGLDMSCIEWCYKHDVSAIGADDHAIEVIASMPQAEAKLRWDSKAAQYAPRLSSHVGQG